MLGGTETSQVENQRELGSPLRLLGFQIGYGDPKQPNTAWR